MCVRERCLCVCDVCVCMMCVCMCMCGVCTRCMCSRVCTSMYVEVRGQPWMSDCTFLTSCLRLDLFVVWPFLLQPSWAVSFRAAPAFTWHLLGMLALQMGATSAGLCASWGSEFRFSHLHSKHSTHGAISQRGRSFFGQHACENVYMLSELVTLHSELWCVRHYLELSYRVRRKFQINFNAFF